MKKKNQENFEEWLEGNLAVADSIIRTASPHSVDFVIAMEAKRILTTTIDLYKKETNEQ